MFGCGHGAGPLSLKEAALVREQCINDFKAKQLARQMLVQERFDKVRSCYFKNIFCTLYYAHSSTEGRQRESSKTLRSPFSAGFWRHCVLNVGTQCHGFSTPERRNLNINLN